MAFPVDAVSVVRYAEEEGTHVMNAVGRFRGPALGSFA